MKRYYKPDRLFITQPLTVSELGLMFDRLQPTRIFMKRKAMEHYFDLLLPNLKAHYKAYGFPQFYDTGKKKWVDALPFRGVPILEW